MSEFTPVNAQYEHTSRQLAGWAIALAFAICVPFLPLVGVGLGVTVLVRSRKGGSDHGTGKAIAAIVIGSVTGVAIGSYVVVGLVSGFGDGGPERDEAGEVTDSGLVEPTELRIGDCFNDPRLVGGAQAQNFPADLVEVLPCDRSHDAQVFHTFALPGDSYPTTDGLEQAVRVCGPAFRDYVGQPEPHASLLVAYYYPTAQSWTVSGDRSVTCFVYERRGNKLEGSMEDGQRTRA